MSSGRSAGGCRTTARNSGCATTTTGSWTRSTMAWTANGRLGAGRRRECRWPSGIRISPAPPRRTGRSARKSAARPARRIFLRRRLLGPAATLVPITATWRYDDFGIDLGTAWRAPGFNDSGWGTGTGLFFVEDGPLPAPKNTPLNRDVEYLLLPRHRSSWMATQRRRSSASGRWSMTARCFTSTASKCGG